LCAVLAFGSIKVDAKMIDFILTYWPKLYALAGLITLLTLIRAGQKTPESAEILSESLGRMVMLSMIAWPYVLVCWVFSWAIWLKPIRVSFIAHVHVNGVPPL
jgi:hypothetical protein